MRIVRFPGGEYYLEKGKNFRGSPFIFNSRAVKKTKRYYTSIGGGLIGLPDELVGKRLMFKVELVEDDE